MTPNKRCLFICRLNPSRVAAVFVALNLGACKTRNFADKASDSNPKEFAQTGRQCPVTVPFDCSQIECNRTVDLATGEAMENEVIQYRLVGQEGRP